MRDDMQIKKNVTYVISYNVMKHFFVTVMKQKSALAIWGLTRCFASCVDLLIDGNKARAKPYCVFILCSELVILFLFCFVLFSIL